MKKKLLITAGILFVILLAMFLFITNGLSEGARVDLHGIDLSNVADGDYTGVYDFKRWSNTVIVHVKNGEIVDIDAEDDITNVSGEIVRRVIEAQNITVDAVSGATVSSKAYLKAIENAFR